MMIILGVICAIVLIIIIGESHANEGAGHANEERVYANDERVS